MTCSFLGDAKTYLCQAALEVNGHMHAILLPDVQKTTAVMQDVAECGEVIRKLMVIGQQIEAMEQSATKEA